MSAAVRKPETRLLLLLQIVCASSAIASLPSNLIHPLWLATFIIPAALFLFLGTGSRRRIIPTWLRFLLALACQGATAYATYSFVGRLDEKSSLACSLLPALTYFTLRREPSDTSLSLFLSFCFLLIGIMLNHDTADWTLLIFLASCAWAMQIEATNRALLLRHAIRGRAMGMGPRILRRIQVVGALMLLIFLGYQFFDILPSPGGSTDQKRSAAASFQGNRSVGLNNRFDLSGAEGSPLSLSSDRVLLVNDPTMARVPSDLYLRMTYFDIPGLDEWRMRRISTVKQTVDQPFYVYEALDGPTERQLAITRLEASDEGQMYLPPYTVGITGIRRLEHNRTAGYFRSLDPDERGYEITYQRPHKLRLELSINPNVDRIQLTRLPRALRSVQMRKLAEDLGGPKGREGPPLVLARRIARGLESRCKYELREPTGPHDEVLHNFLFGDRRGYCMHFATALAVMLRLRNVPCRIAVGYHAGTEEPDGSRVFGSQNAHAWVEIPLRQVEWVLVDPTPPADRARPGWPDPKGEEESSADSEAAADDASSASSFLSGLRDPLANPGAFLAVFFSFVFLSVVMVLILARRSRGGTAKKTAVRPSTDTVRARRWLEKILRILEKAGRPKSPRATLEQYLGTLRSEKKLDIPVLARAFDVYQEVRFGSRSLDPTRAESLAEGLSSAEDFAG